MAAQESKTPSITWDEEVIAEHDKLRGTRMKIDEPDTPFAYLDNEDLEEEEGDSMSAETGKSEGVLRGGEDVTDARVSPPPDARPGDLSSQWAALEGKLEHAALEAEAGELVVGAEKHSTEHKKKVFKDKRAAHYNEFQRVKEMREKMARGELDDEDEDE